MLKLIISIMLLFSGAVFSAPEDSHQRKLYTASLNSMASIVMNWYGNILDAENRYTDAVKPDYWQDYIAQFPVGITQIEITSTDLIQLETTDQYQFIVDIKLRSKQENKIRTQSMINTFLFGLDASKQLILQKITSTQPKIAKVQSAEIISDNKFNHSYFNSREVAYAWLSYLDDAALSEEIKKQFDQVKYSLTIGAEDWQGSALSVLSTRKNYLAEGGHLLRVVKTEPGNQLSIHTIELTIEWRGVDKENTPVWANVQQIIEYKHLKGGGWEIISVKEKHLLPDTEPWIGLLC